MAKRLALLRQNGRGAVRCEVGTGLAHSARWRGPRRIMRRCRPRNPSTEYGLDRSTKIGSSESVRLTQPSRARTNRELLARRFGEIRWPGNRDLGKSHFHRHYRPIALAPFIIRWGPDISSDVLRRSVRCAHKRALLTHPSWVSSQRLDLRHSRSSGTEPNEGPERGEGEPEKTNRRSERWADHLDRRTQRQKGTKALTRLQV
jgi:hypothetical protein